MREDNGKKDKSDKWYERVGDIINWVSTLFGIAAAIFAIRSGERKGFFACYVFAIASQSVMLVLWTWNMRVKYRYQDKLQKCEEEIEQLRASNQARQIEFNEKLEREQKKYDEAISDIITNVKNACKNNELGDRIPEINADAYATLNTLKQSGIKDEAILTDEIIRSRKAFQNSLFDVYKRYTTNLLSYVVTISEAYLHMRGYSHKVAVSLKLFDQPLLNIDESATVIVYTAFRDKWTYDKNKNNQNEEREIGKRRYCIDENSDFNYCLRKDHFVINNVTSKCANYSNQHREFESIYNCAVVVPIRTRQSDSSYRFYGYLCCDCMNDDKNEIFDQKSGQLLFSMAQLYGNFMKTLESNWVDRTDGLDGCPKSFLNVVYKETYKGTE